MLWGGNDGYTWLQDMAVKIKELDTRKSTYFGENIDEQNEKKEEKSMTKKKEDEVEDFAKSEEVVDEVDMAKDESATEEDTEFSKTEEVEMSTESDEVDMAKPTDAEIAKEKAKEDAETPADEKKETPAEKAKEEKDGTEKKFSITAIDIEAILAMLGEDAGTLVDECDYSKEVDFASMEKLASTMYSKMCKMAQEHQAYMSETMDYADLKKFKAEYDTSQMNYAVDTVLKKVEVSLTKEEIDEARKNSENFNFSNITAWQNQVFALAYSKDKKIVNNDTGVKKYGILENSVAKPNVANSPWPVLK